MRIVWWTNRLDITGCTAIHCLISRAIRASADNWARRTFATTCTCSMLRKRFRTTVQKAYDVASFVSSAFSLHCTRLIRSSAVLTIIQWGCTSQEIMHARLSRFAKIFRLTTASFRWSSSQNCIGDRSIARNLFPLHRLSWFRILFVFCSNEEEKTEGI